MRSFSSLMSLLLCESMAAAAILNINPQPIPQSAPDRSAQFHVRRPEKVFYHDSTLARRSTLAHHAQIAKGIAVKTENGSNSTLTLRRKAADVFSSGPTGACGITFVDSDFVVALSEANFNAANHCYENITISHNDKSTQARIVDVCHDCPQDGLDLAYDLFSYFAPTSLGVLYGEWSYNSVQPESAQDNSKTEEVPTPSPLGSQSAMTTNVVQAHLYPGP